MTLLINAQQHCTMPPIGFVSKNDSIYCLTADEDGEDIENYLCSAMRMIAFARSTCGSNWSKLIAISDPDGREQQVLVPEDITISKKIAMLKQKGLQIRTGASPRKEFEKLLNTWIPGDRLTLVNRLGWTDDNCTTFMMDDKFALGDDKVFMQNAAITSTSANRGTSGTLEEWLENVAKPCIANPLLITAVAHAFAGPLLAPLNIEGGGLHLRGGSSSGKTTVLKVALSVWGKPDPSSWSTTC